MARTKQTDVLDVPADYEPGRKSNPPPADSAPPVPDGYAARVIVWPDAYWRVFDKQAQRGGLTTSEYLKRLLAHMARE